ncbi:hypothetical protein NL533_33100, partial [Klebsiella pneumoniae]|nr:hypothetical protein [Klebsiella pneumoniae]
RTNGTRWYVTQGEPEPEHLIHVHGWTAEQLRVLTDDELHLLHGMSHTGLVNPKDYVVSVDAQPAAVASEAVAGDPLKIISPATWN